MFYLIYLNLIETYVICNCLRYLGEVYLSENVELAEKFSFLSPHIAPIIGSGTSSNYLAEALLKHAGKDHLLLIPHNVGWVQYNILFIFIKYDFSSKLFDILCSEHWVLVAIHNKTEMIYFMDPAPNAKISHHHDLKNFIER